MRKFKKIKLIQGKYALIDVEDFEWLSKNKWFFHANYARRWEKRKLIQMHRVILNLTKSIEFADHINGNCLDNRRSNLRVVSHLQNNTNRRPYTVSGYKGVYWNMKLKKWRAQICNKFLGNFKTKKEAALIYNIHAKEKYGEYARINKI